MSWLIARYKSNHSFPRSPRGRHERGLMAGARRHVVVSRVQIKQNEQSTGSRPKIYIINGASIMTIVLPLCRGPDRPWRDDRFKFYFRISSTQLHGELKSLSFVSSRRAKTSAKVLHYSYITETLQLELLLNSAADLIPISSCIMLPFLFIFQWCGSPIFNLPSF